MYSSCWLSDSSSVYKNWAHQSAFVWSREVRASIRRVFAPVYTLSVIYSSFSYSIRRWLKLSACRMGKSTIRKCDIVSTHEPCCCGVQEAVSR